MSEPFIGSIIMVGFTYAPRGWALCNGQILSIQQNSALFALLGTTYGGNGSSTFALPDLRGRVPIHAGMGGPGPGLSNYNLGQVSGTENITLQQNQMPIHNHLMGTVGNDANDSIPNGYLAIAKSGSATVNAYSNAAPDVTLPANAITAAGGSQPFPLLQPYLAINFIIALQGIFPSRN